jgi:hypothetical protein
VHLAGLLPFIGTQHILLRLAAAQPLAGLLTLAENTCAWRKMGFREKLPEPSIR